MAGGAFEAFICFGGEEGWGLGGALAFGASVFDALVFSSFLGGACWGAFSSYI